MAYSLGITITEATLTADNIKNNTSTVTVKVTCSWNAGTWDAWNYTKYCTIDGTDYDFSSVDINPNQTTSGSSTLFTKTLDIAHNSNGKKTLEVYAYVKTGTSSGTQTKSASKTLTTIARKSTFDLSSDDSTYPLGTAVNLKVTRQSTSFTHSIKATCGNSSYYIKADGTTSSSEVKHSDCDLNFTLPMAWASQNTKGTSLSVTFLLTTYSGSTKVGTHSLTQTCKIPNNTSTTPSVSLTVTDTSGCFNKYGEYVQGKSALEIKVTCTPKYSASITGRVMTFDGVTYSPTSDSATVTVKSIKGTGSLTLKVTVKDSRGFTNSASVTCNVLAYSSPAITKLAIYRSNSSGTSSSSGTYLTAQYSAKVSALDNKNSAKYYVWYKKVSETSYTKKQLTDSSYAPTNLKIVFEAEAVSSYDVKIVVEDDFYNGDTAVPKSGTGASVKKVWSMAPKGLGFAFGKVAEYVANLGERFEVVWNARFYKDVQIDGTVHPFKILANQYFNVGAYGINLQNSDLYNVNAVIFADVADGTNEGLIFARANGGWDTLRVYDEKIYLIRNSTGTFNGNDWIGGETCEVDYLVETGTSGIWTCEKWASGKAVAYGFDTKTVPCTSASGAVYFGTTTVTLPSGLFTGIDNIQVAAGGSSGAGYAWFGRYATVTNTSFNALFFATVSDTKDILFSAQIIGTWK